MNLPKHAPQKPSTCKTRLSRPCLSLNHEFLEQGRPLRASCTSQQPKPQHLLPTDFPAPGVGASMVMGTQPLRPHLAPGILSLLAPELVLSFHPMLHHLATAFCLDVLKNGCPTLGGVVAHLMVYRHSSVCCGWILPKNTPGATNGPPLQDTLLLLGQATVVISLWSGLEGQSWSSSYLETLTPAR